MRPKSRRHFLLGAIRSASAALLVLVPWAARAQAAAAPFSASRLLGSWSGRATRPDGVTATTRLALTANGHFAGSAEIDGQPFWTFSGTWALSGNQLSWTYVMSSRPLPETPFVDIDEVLSVDARQMTLRSKRSGKMNTFQRLPQ